MTCPDGYKEAWAVMRDGGWTAPRADPELGGSGLPQAIGAFLSEVMSGASMAFTMYVGLSSAAARVITRYAPDHLARPVAEKLFTGQWGGTMCLTEAGAGSSVGDNRTKAVPSGDDGVWLLEGEKIFITGGDSNLVDNIVPPGPGPHPGLARGHQGPEPVHGPQVSGSTRRASSSASATARTCSSSSTRWASTARPPACSGSDPLARATAGWSATERDGMRLMFDMMNEARIGVGVQGLAAGSAAFQYARHYVHERVQGTSLKHMRDPGAKRVAIVEHPDVRRMLMDQKVLVETMRAMSYRVCVYADLSEATPTRISAPACIVGSSCSCRSSRPCAPTSASTWP